MRRRRPRTPMSAMDEINLTPLLDLTFLLLIAFMITMPTMEYGTNIKAPEMNSGKLPENNFVSITLTKDGTYMVDRDAVSRKELITKLEQLSTQNPKPQLLIRGDGSRSYNDVIGLLSLVRRSGFADATLVTQAESTGE